jgi:MraZ protein
MSRFRGKFDYSIDAKGRFNVPAKFRKALAPEADESFVICRAPNGCLRAYPQDAWNRYEDELEAMPQTPEAVKFQRLLYSTVSESKLDAQGRIMITPQQARIAGIDKHVTLIGKPGHIEIWDTQRFEEYIGDGADFDEVFFHSVEAGIRGK